jgi:hypothetical protein
MRARVLLCLALSPWACSQPTPLPLAGSSDIAQDGGGSAAPDVPDEASELDAAPDVGTADDARDALLQDAVASDAVGSDSVALGVDAEDATVDVFAVVAQPDTHDVASADLPTPDSVEVAQDADPSDGSPCDDQSACTSGDQYASGVCGGSAVACDDGEPCTQDVCWDRTGCVHVWTPGCGGKPCGDCPEDLGFACLPNGGDGFKCVNEATGEAYVAAGVFRFGDTAPAESVAGVENLDWAVASGRIAPSWLYVEAFIIDVDPLSYRRASELGYQSGWPCPSDYDVDECAWQLWFTDCSSGSLADPSAALCNDYSDFEPPPADGIGQPVWMSWVWTGAPGKRPCSEFEWEKAAVGGCARLGCIEGDFDCCAARTRPFPWGFAPPTCEHSHKPGCPLARDLAGYMYTVPVGTTPFDVSAYGVRDMNGNGEEGVVSVVGLGAPELGIGIADVLAANVGKDDVVAIDAEAISCAGAECSYWIRPSDGEPTVLRWFGGDFLADVSTVRLCRSVPGPGAGP